MEFGSQTVMLADGGVLNVLTLSQPILGPINLNTISVFSASLSGLPDVSDNHEWAVLSCPLTSEVVVTPFLESDPAFAAKVSVP
ncbi:MAG: hypothetical protein QF645_11980, partial [Planctomycetota bacterium]|nr:hypothetical protein [Planctomycetota bacterium]